MSTDVSEEEKKRLTPESGFDLCGIDYFESFGKRLYFIAHYERYQDALEAKKDRDRPEEYIILYHGAP